MKLENFVVIVAITGIVVLFWLSSTLEPRLLPISNITIKMLESPVRVQGKITEIKEYNENILLTINDSSDSIDVYVYKKIKLEKLELAINSSIEVSGKVSEYHGKLEIVAEKIKLL